MKNWQTNSNLFINNNGFRKTQWQVNNFSISPYNELRDSSHDELDGWMPERYALQVSCLALLSTSIANQLLPVLIEVDAHIEQDPRIAHPTIMFIVPLGYKRFAHINISLFTLLCQLAIRAMNFITAKWTVNRSCCSMEWMYKRQSTHTGIHHQRCVSVCVCVCVGVCVCACEL